LNPGSLPIRRDHVGNTAIPAGFKCFDPITCVNDSRLQICDSASFQAAWIWLICFTTGLLVTEQQNTPVGLETRSEHGEQSTEVLQAASGTGGFRTYSFSLRMGIFLPPNGYSLPDLPQAFISDL